MTRKRSLAVSASECEASDAMAGEPVNAAAPTLASPTPRSARRATHTVRPLPLGIMRLYGSAKLPDACADGGANYRPGDNIARVMHSRVHPAPGYSGR